MSDVLERLASLRVLPVLTAASATEAEEACRALIAGGLPVVEITLRTEAAVEAIRRVADLDDILVAAGTVRSAEQLNQAITAGASFAVAPGFDEGVVSAAAELDVPFVPGIATPSEIERALAAGCETVKLFPASQLGGAAFVRAVSPVYPGVRFIPTGGVAEDNLAAYLALPAVLACGGTWICERALLETRRFDEVEQRARAAAMLADAVVSM